MNISSFLVQMVGNAERIRQSTRHVSDEPARWKPASDAWSILEAINL